MGTKVDHFLTGSILCAVRALETDPRIAARKVATFVAAKALDASDATRSAGAVAGRRPVDAGLTGSRRRLLWLWLRRLSLCLRLLSHAADATRRCGLGRLARLLLPRQRLRDQGLAYSRTHGREHRVAVAKHRPQGLILRVQILSRRLRNGGRLSVVRHHWQERRRGRRRLRSGRRLIETRIRLRLACQLRPCLLDRAVGAERIVVNGNERVALEIRLIVYRHQSLTRHDESPTGIADTFGWPRDVTAPSRRGLGLSV